MALDRVQVERVVSELFTGRPRSDVRLVGAASSLVRRIDLPVGDIDILFRTRAALDDWFASLTPRFDVDTAPEWIDDTCQYFARVRVDDVVVELSTVEMPSDSDALECVGRGPWCHYDVISCDRVAVQVVANELRLATEVSRGRVDRSGPIIEHMRDVGYDAALARRAFAGAGVADATIERVISSLATNPQ
jgi:hypothetical protein